MSSRLIIVLCTAIFLTMTSSTHVSGQESSGEWTGKVQDEALRNLAPESSYIADADTWSKLWKAWRPNEEQPKVDFNKELILVGTVPGPNLVLMRPQVNDEGDVRFVVGGTRIGGPGFGYKLIKIASEGIKSVNGQDVVRGTAESITVSIVGKLQTGIFAIGGETTGTTITAKGITWELDFNNHADLREASEGLNGKMVRVKGSLERRTGVEISERWIVHVTELEGVDF